MARDFKRQNKLAVISDLNVTPLIDLAFSLLIIFMITTPVIEQYNRIDLPSQQTSQSQEPPKLDDQFITIEANGQFRWGKDAVTQGSPGSKTR
jgi:biopolymer transport protein ExbD